MDFKGVIEFVKYTLALTAACFVYSLEKLAPSAKPGLVLFFLGIFAAAALVGVFIFSAATAALHKGKDTKLLKKAIEFAGWAHFGLLGIGLLVFALVLGYRVVNEPPKPPPVYCEPATASTSGH